MKYQIANESPHWIRIRIIRNGRSLSAEETEILRYALGRIHGVSNVRIYPATAGCALEYHCSRRDIISRLDALRFENVEMFAEKNTGNISAEEMKNRKLDPKLKRKLRTRILVEAVADAVLPAPVQMGYHVYQMITLKNL